MLIFTHKFGIRMQCVIRDWLHRSRQKSHFLQVQGLGTKECLCCQQKCVLPKKNGFFSLLWTRRTFSSEKAGKEKQIFQGSLPVPMLLLHPPTPIFSPDLGPCIHPLLYPNSSAASQGRVSISVWGTGLQSPTQGELSPGARSGSGFRGESLRN